MTFPTSDPFNIKTMLFDTVPFDLTSVRTALIAGSLLIVALSKFPKMKVPVQGIPMASNSHWLFGHVKVLVGDFRETWWKLGYERANDDGLCSFWLFSRPMITVTRVEHARAILAASHNRAGSRMKTYMKMFLGENSLPFLNGKEWKHTRTVYTKALSKSAVTAMTEPIHDIITTMIKSLDRKITENHGHPVDTNMETIFNLILSDISGKIFFGMDFKCCETLEQHPITEAIKFLFTEVGRRYKSPFNPAARYLCLPTQSNRKFRESVKFIRDTLRDIINERRQTMLTTPSEKSKRDFITSALESLGTEKDTLDIDKVIDILTTAHTAAFDSSSAALVYIFYCLASNPFAENECLKEIDQVMKEGDSFTNQERLPYCNAVVTEATRLYPSFILTMRSLEKPVTLGNVTVPAGMDVTLPLWHLQRDERNFHRADEFLPERWVKQNADGSWVDHLSADDTNKDMMPSRASFSSDDTTLPGSDPNSSDKSTHLNHTSFREQNGHVRPADKNAFLTFSAGGRSCPGYHLARKELCLITVELLRHFKFELGPGFKLNPINFAITQKNEGGLPVIISKRK